MQNNTEKKRKRDASVYSGRVLGGFVALTAALDQERREEAKAKQLAPPKKELPSSPKPLPRAKAKSKK